MGKHAVEIEVKLPYPGPAAARTALRKAGFLVITRRAFETNVIYDTPSGSLRAKGIVVRYRTWGKAHIITYKGPAERAPGKLAGSVHKRRTERETLVADGGPIVTTWEAAGLSPSFRYEKYRTVLARPRERGHAMLDETPIGTYVELEGSASWIDRTARLLGFAPHLYIQDSYAALQSKACVKQGLAFRDLLFPPDGKET